MKKREFDLNFQNIVDIWGKSQSRRIKKHANIAYLKSTKFTRKFQQHNWDQEGEKFTNIFFASLAVFQGASKELPLKTLSLLGRLSTRNTQKVAVKKIIKDNIIKIDDHFYKLDDLEHQAKIRKVLKNSKYQEFYKSA